MDLIKLYNACSEFTMLRHEKSWEKSTGNITPKHLCQLYSQSTTANQRNLRSHRQVMYRLKIKTFNEVVHLYMRPGNVEFFFHQQDFRVSSKYDHSWHWTRRVLRRRFLELLMELDNKYKKKRIDHNDLSCWTLHLGWKRCKQFFHASSRDIHQYISLHWLIYKLI